MKAEIPMDCAPALKALVLAEPDLQLHILGIALDVKEAAAEIDFVGPPSAAARMIARGGGKLACPSIVLKFERFIADPETGQVGVRIRCSDDDLATLTSWLRSSAIRVH